jgi:putative flavoprotein involved in K+ transport
VFLACGKAPWAPRRIGDRDIFWWVTETGLFDQPPSALPTPAARLTANILGTGRNGGHDLNLRKLRVAGATLLGHFLGAEDGRARFAPDLAESVAWGDARYREFGQIFRKLAAERSLPMPELPEPESFDGRSPEELDLAGLGAVVFAGGFRPDYASWINVPGAFDALGFPVHSDGASTAASGLYFVGAHFLRSRKSSLLFGVGEDAAVVARQIAQGTAAGASE